MNSNIENMLLAQVIHSTPAMKKYFTHGISLKHYTGTRIYTQRTLYRLRSRKFLGMEFGEAFSLWVHTYICVCFIYISHRNIFQTHDSAVSMALGTLQAPGPFYNEPCRWQAFRCLSPDSEPTVTQVHTYAHSLPRPGSHLLHGGSTAKLMAHCCL